MKIFLDQPALLAGGVYIFGNEGGGALSIEMEGSDGVWIDAGISFTDTGVKAAYWASNTYCRAVGDGVAWVAPAVNVK